MFLFILLSSPLFAQVEESCPLASPYGQIREGLDHFWAQEYTGADLLRRKLERSKDFHVFPHLVQIWDSRKNLHGERVSRLIAGPYPSSPIPLEKSFDYKAFDQILKETLENDRFIRCVQNGTCPSYINISMEFCNDDSSKRFQQIMRTLIMEQDITVVFSAGNDGGYMSSLIRKLAGEENIVAVGNCHVNGDPFLNSSYAPEIAVCAPVGNLVRTYDFAGNPKNFSGTSAAAPQVTGALAAFTAITGYSLNPRESTKILKKTAIPHPRIPAGGNMGAGILNAWKIGEVAFKLKRLCGDDSSCFSDNLQSEETYIFPMNKQNLLERARVIFPGCAGEEAKGGTIREKRKLLRKLRRAALLETSDGRLWRLISCINREQRCLSKHAKFYEGLADRADKNDENVFVKLLLNEEYTIFERYVVNRTNIDADILRRIASEIIRSIRNIGVYKWALEIIINHSNIDAGALRRITSDIISKIARASVRLPEYTQLLKMIIKHPKIDAESLGSMRKEIADRGYYIPGYKRLLRMIDRR